MTLCVMDKSVTGGHLALQEGRPFRGERIVGVRLVLPLRAGASVEARAT